MKPCSVPGCKEPLSQHQVETTEKLFGKPYCIKHEAVANEEATRATEAGMSPRDKVLTYLAREKFKEQSIKGIFLLEDGSNVAVDLRGIGPKTGVLINNEVVEEGHGISKVSDIRNSIAKILKSKSTQTSQEKALAKRSDQQIDDLIERAKAKRFVQGQGDFYKVQGKERPDSAMIQKLANEAGISTEILEAMQTEKCAHILVRGHLGDQYTDAVVHHDYETEFMLKTMEIINKNPEILDHYEGTKPVIKEGAKIKQGDETIDAKYYLVHTLLSFKKFSLRDAATKASAIVQMKLLNQDSRDEDEIKSERAEAELVMKSRR